MKLLWRNTALQARLGPFDARAVFPLALWLMHWAYWTLGIALAAIAFLVILDKFGIPVNTAFYQARTLMLGRIRPVRENQIIFRRRCRW